MGSYRPLPDTIYLVKHFVSFRAEIDFALIHYQWQMSLLLSCPLCTAQRLQSDTEVAIPQLLCYYLQGHSGVAHPYPN